VSTRVVDAYLDELLVDLDAIEHPAEQAVAEVPAATAVPLADAEPASASASATVAEPEPEPASAPLADPAAAEPAATALAAGAPATSEPVATGNATSVTACAATPMPEPSPAAPPPAPVPAPMPSAPAAVAHVAPLSIPRPAPVVHDAGGDAIPRQRAATTSRWLRVGIGTDYYAFELLRVQEVVRVAPIVAMRGAAPSVRGVMNLRGRIVPVFDLGRWLGGADVVTTEHSRIVVVEREDELIGVLVTRVEDVATLGREHIEPPLIGSDAGAIVGIARVGRSPTVLLDANALFD
jgi:purine-binding chemotaxis protein CheW